MAARKPAVPKGAMKPWSSSSLAAMDAGDRGAAGRMVCIEGWVGGARGAQRSAVLRRLATWADWPGDGTWVAATSHLRTCSLLIMRPKAVAGGRSRGNRVAHPVEEGKPEVRHWSAHSHRPQQHAPQAAEVIAPAAVHATAIHHMS